MIVLGPIGLLLSIHRSRTSSETFTVPGLIASSVVLVLSISVLPALEAPAVITSPIGALTLLVIAPVVFSLFVIVAPWLVAQRQIGYGRALLRSAAPALFSTVLVLALLLPVMVPLSLLILERTRSYLASGTLVWAAGACAGLVPILILRSGHRLLGKGGERRIHWLLTIVLLISAIVLVIVGLDLVQQTLHWLSPVIAGGPSLG